MAEVELHRVTKVFNSDILAVSSVDIRIRDREFVVLVGPSGCGKSTVLRLIAGLETLTSGELIIEGKLMNDVPPHDRDMAMVFQNYALYPHMTVRQNMAFGLKVRRTAGEVTARRVQEAAELLGIEDLLDRKPRALSGGQRQRVALGRVMVKKPGIYLFDEPLSNLDAGQRSRMRAQIVALHQRLDATMIYVTHDQVEAMAMADRIVVLKDGRIQQVGPPMELYRAPRNRFVAGFIGNPAMNFLAGAVTCSDPVGFRHAGFDLRTPDMDGILGRHVDRAVVLGIRPEHIHIRGGRQKPLPDRWIKALLTRIEALGSDTFLHLRLGQDVLVARTSPDDVFSVGDKLDIQFESTGVHYFDAETGKSLVQE